MQRTDATDVAAVERGWRPWADGNADRIGVRSRWHEARSSCLRKPIGKRLEKCGKRAIRLRCSCREMLTREACALPLCEFCRKRRAAKDRDRLRVAVRSRLSEKHRKCLYKVCLTTDHSGDLGEDALWWQGALTGFCRALRRALPFCAWVTALEATDGSEQDGHAHAHLVIAADWLSYAKVHSIWERVVASRGRTGSNLDCERVSIRKQQDAADHAAAYLMAAQAAEYLTDGSLNPDHIPLSGERAGAWFGALWGKRKLRASVGFWQGTQKQPGCPCCGVFVEFMGVAGWPEGLEPGYYERSLWDGDGPHPPGGAGPPGLDPG